MAAPLSPRSQAVMDQFNSVSGFLIERCMVIRGQEDALDELPSSKIFNETNIEAIRKVVAEEVRLANAKTITHAGLIEFRQRFVINYADTVTQKANGLSERLRKAAADTSRDASLSGRVAASAAADSRRPAPDLSSFDIFNASATARKPAAKKEEKKGIEGKEDKHNSSRAPAQRDEDRFALPSRLANQSRRPTSPALSVASRDSSATSRRDSRDLPRPDALRNASASADQGPVRRERRSALADLLAELDDDSTTPTAPARRERTSVLALVGSKDDDKR